MSRKCPISSSKPYRPSLQALHPAGLVMSADLIESPSPGAGVRAGLGGLVLSKGFCSVCAVHAWPQEPWHLSQRLGVYTITSSRGPLGYFGSGSKTCRLLSSRSLRQASSPPPISCCSCSAPLQRDSALPFHVLDHLASATNEPMLARKPGDFLQAACVSGPG